MPRLSLSQCVTLACLLEVSSPKPGNVHRGADFDDLSLNDFLASAVAIGPILERAKSDGVGPTVLAAVRATQEMVDTNVNLGMILLLAPLAAVDRSEDLREGVAQVLENLTAEDTAHIWKAINEAHPGGMGQVNEMDLAGSAPLSIVEAMRSAADRDRVAAQYASGFADVFDRIVPWMLGSIGEGWNLTAAIVRTHVRMMSELPDTLIARKAGEEVAKTSATYAKMVLEAGSPDSDEYYAALADLDFWLRSDGRNRNPGTTADLIAAGLFVVLRDELIDPPYR